MILKDGIRSHPKILQAGAEATWFWVCAIDYSRSTLLDGFVPDAALPLLGRFRLPVKKLVQTCLAHGLFDAADGGIRIHDYLEFNDTREVVLADKEWDRRRKELYSDAKLLDDIRTRDRDCCRYCGEPVNWKDRRSPKGGQFDHVIPRGPNTLANVVVACRGCNNSKGGRTPEQARMPLLPTMQEQNGPSYVLSGSSSDLSLTRARPRVGVGVGTGVGTGSGQISDLDLGEEREKGAGEALFGDDVWTAWREAGARHGHDRIDANPSGANWPKHLATIRRVVVDRDELEAALDCWWASPFVTAGRNVGLFASALSEVLAHLAAGHAHLFRDPHPPAAPPAQRRFCDHNPECTTWKEHRRRELDEMRIAEGRAPHAVDSVAS